MKRLKYVSCLLALVLCFALFAAGCSNGENPSGAAASGNPSAPSQGGGDIPASVKIGIVNPTTGGLAGFGEGTPWTENLILDEINAQGGIYFEAYDATLPVELVYYDSQSSTTTASEMAQKLVEEDKVDLLLARHTPDTVDPVMAIAERFGVPCIGTDAPVDVWLDEGEHETSFHAHWVLDDLYQLYLDCWEQMGYGPGSKVGFLFPTDADGNLFRDYFLAHLPEDGYTDIVDPGQYPQGTSDYTDIINTFKQQGVEIVFGANITPDFGAFLLQANQMGFQPPVMSMAKAPLVTADVESMGVELSNNVVTEVWWSPDRPFTSSLTGMTGAKLAELYQEASGRPVTPSMAAKYAGVEIAIDALQRARSLDPDDLVAAIAETDIDTLVGHIQFNADKYCVVPLTGGQWQLQDDGSIKLFIINNSLNPDLPASGEVRPYGG